MKVTSRSLLSLKTAAILLFTIGCGEPDESVDTQTFNREHFSTFNDPTEIPRTAKPKPIPTRSNPDLKPNSTRRIVNNRDTAIEDNLLKCRDLGLFLGDCTLVPTTLFPEAENEQIMEVRFLYDCVGHSVEFGFEAYGFHKIRPSREPQSITISGRRLKLVDNNPESTLMSTFDFGCQLKILEKKIQLSAISHDDAK